MKRFHVLLLAVVFLGVPTWVFAGNELLWEKQLPFKEATIHYIMSLLQNDRFFIR